jgi:hypothetical protein
VLLEQEVLDAIVGQEAGETETTTSSPDYDGRNVYDLLLNHPR